MKPGRPSVIGVVNVTPDSFSDGGNFFSQEKAVQHALQMERDGADLIDIGAESTRPGALVINAEEEILEMNNGCICCTVRGDLIRILGNLMKRKDRFDAIVIETTGMADPGPVAQTFFVDDVRQWVRSRFGVTLPAERTAVWGASIGGELALALGFRHPGIYGAVFVKPLLIFSRYFLGWFVDGGILGGAAWLLGGTATLGGAILQRWQSGNLRSYAAWLTLGAAAVLIAAMAFHTGWSISFQSVSSHFILKAAGH